MLKLLQPTSRRTRLWQGGGAVALVMLTFVVGNAFVAPQRAVHVGLIGQDFLAFYTGGTFARQGRYAELYDIDAVAAHEHAVARASAVELPDDARGPWWNPPFYAWVFAPLSALPFRAAWAVWMLVNVASLCGAIVLMSRMLPNHQHVAQPPSAVIPAAGRSYGNHSRGRLCHIAHVNLPLVALLVLVSMPCIMALGHAQNTCTSLLILTAAVTCWRAKRAVLAGICAGLLCYKPQLAALLAAAIVMSLGWRAFVGLCISGGALLAAGEWSMPGSTLNYLRQLPLNLRAMQVEHTYLWERHVTLKAMWRMLLQGRDAGETSPIVTALTVACGFAVVTGLFIAWHRSRATSGDVPWNADTTATRRDRFIAAVIVATPLLMPFYFDYDLLLLAVPAVLYAGEVMRLDHIETRWKAERWLFVTWSALFLWTFVNPGLAKLTRVNGSAIVLSCLACQHVLRAGRRRRVLRDEPYLPQPIALPRTTDRAAA